MGSKLGTTLKKANKVCQASPTRACRFLSPKSAPVPTRERERQATLEPPNSSQPCSMWVIEVAGYRIQSRSSPCCSSSQAETPAANGMTKLLSKEAGYSQTGHGQRRLTSLDSRFASSPWAELSRPRAGLQHVLSSSMYCRISFVFQARKNWWLGRRVRSEFG